MAEILSDGMEKMSKMNKNRLAAMKASSSGGAVSGLSSSLAFTPGKISSSSRSLMQAAINCISVYCGTVQGIELVDPAEQKRRVQAANDNWFKNEPSGTFSVLPGAGKSK